MADEIRVMLEIGPNGKKVVAVAPDWPGLERGAKTGEAAIERLCSYLPRYAHVATLAGMDAAFDGTVVKAFLRILDTEPEGYRRADDHRFVLPHLGRAGNAEEEAAGR